MYDCSTITAAVLPCRAASDTHVPVSSVRYNHTASSSCHPARVTQGTLPANVLVRSMALAQRHLLSILFSRRGRPWNAAGRKPLLPHYSVSTWSYTARHTSKDGRHVANDALFHPRRPCRMTSTDCFSSQTTLSDAGSPNIPERGR